KAARTSSWNLGTLAGANIHNGGQLTGATSLTLGVVIPATIHATGAVAALTASEITASAVTAGSWGMVTVTGNLGLALIGSAGAWTSDGKLAGLGLKGLPIAGELFGSTVKLLNGDATAITVGRTINGSTIAATDTGTRGNLKAVPAGRLTVSTLDARSIGTL